MHLKGRSSVLSDFVINNKISTFLKEEDEISMMRKFVLIMMLMLTGCSLNDQYQAPDNESLENIPVHEETTNKKIAASLFVINHQEFYKNSTVFLNLDADGDISKYKEKQLGVLPLLTIEKKNEDEWEYYQSVEYSHIDSAIKNRVEELIVLNLDTIDFNDGIFRFMMQVFDDQGAYSIYSEEMKWINQFLQSDEIVDNSYLNLYPFSKYEVDGSFKQLIAQPESKEQIRVSSDGCAVLVEKEQYDNLHQVECQVLNPSTCKQTNLKEFLPSNQAMYSVIKYNEGYRDDDFYNRKFTITGEELANWISELNEEDIISIPTCFSLTYNFYDYEIFEISPLEPNNQYIYHFFSDKYTDGAFVQIERVNEQERIVVSNQYLKNKLTLFEYCFSK